MEKQGGAQGFVAGAFSGVAKVSTGHPFDTIKVRLQTSSTSRFRGPWHCLHETISQEGIRGLYKGFTPPLIGFVFMDSILLGSFSIYRDYFRRTCPETSSPAKLPYLNESTRSCLIHGVSGGLAGWTVSLIAAPIEHIKARLQIQYTTTGAQRLYSGPFDCLQKIFTSYGVAGVYRGFFSTIVFRSFFAVFWSSYDVLSRQMQQRTNFSTPLINFLAAGFAAQMYWLTGYPTDVIKQRIMTSPLNGPRWSWMDTARTIYREAGWKGFWRGFLPCILRAFPANAMSIVAFEASMRAMARHVYAADLDI
ncbi:related to carrier protein YMC1, mitochondrial [Fusarium proliferatum]|nr:related to carrier protein YMC1, mitochondrial [Fusarium proliferatum]